MNGNAVPLSGTSDAGSDDKERPLLLADLRVLEMGVRPAGPYREQLTASSGRLRWVVLALAEHNEEILRGRLGLSAEQLDRRLLAGVC